MQAFGHFAHALLRTLHEDGHAGFVVPDELAQVHARIQLLRGRLVSAVQDKADVRNHAQEVLLVRIVEIKGILVVGGHKDLRPGPLAEDLLLLVERIQDGGAVLLEHQFVQQGQVCGVITDRIFHQQDALHTASQNVVLGVHAVFQQLDDGNDKVRTAVPAEDVVDGGAVVLLHLPVNLLGEGREEDDGDIGPVFLHPVGEGEDVHLAHVVHRDDQVPALPGIGQFQRLFGGGGAHEHRRVAKVQFCIFPGNAGVQASVLFQREVVVIVANQQNPADPSGHQRCSVGHI